jgi:hypothetical protein
MYRSVALLLIIALSSFLAPGDNKTDELVMKAAESQLPHYLEKLNPGNEKAYGFTENDDLDGCTISKPYRMMVFNDGFYNNNLAEERNYIHIENEWRVPVMIRDTNRTMLTVNGNPGNYVISAMGTPMLAKELQQKSKGMDDNVTFYLLQVTPLLADFFVAERDNSFTEAQFIPLESAFAAIPALGKNKQPFYTLTEVEKMIKQELTVNSNTIPDNTQSGKTKKRSSK